MMMGKNIRYGWSSQGVSESFDNEGSKMKSMPHEANPQTRPLSKRKKIVFASIGLCVSTLVSLMVVEATLHILHLPFETTWEPAEYRRVQFDPELGWSYIPNQSVSQRFVVGQPEIPVYTDEIGARVGSPGERHDTKAPTAMFVGCSFTFGYGVPYEDTFAGKLGQNPDFDYQVVNLGTEAYGTDQSLLILKRYFDKYNTKVVVYTFIGNHVERNHNYDRRLLFWGAHFVGTKPLFGLRRDGSLYLRKIPRKYEDLPDIRILTYLQIYWMRHGPKPSLDLTSALIREMKSYVESRGATFILVYWSWWEGEGKVMLPMLEGIQANLVDTAANPPPDWHGWGSPWQIPGDSHPNAQAHQYVAGLILEEFRRLKLLP